MIFKPKKTYPGERAGQDGFFILLFSLSLVFFMLAKFLPREPAAKQKTEMLRAAEIMRASLSALKSCSVERGLEIDESVDVNGTGLIGSEFSPMTTSVGSLEAKRTTANPDMAALVVFLLRKAGVKEGDAVAVGGSGSFPALILASLSAAKALDVKPLLICSLGASQWGANRLEFHFLDMLECLREAGIFEDRPVAVSLGGERDIGEGMPQEVRVQLAEDIDESGTVFIQEPELQANVLKKMQIYEREAGERGIKAFINIGGSWSNMGTDSEILNLQPGLSRIGRVPPAGQRGLVFEMAARDVPVLHLLYIRGLVDLYSLPWDPVPLPDAGSGRIYEKIVEGHPLFVILGGLYIVLIAFLLFLFRKRKSCA